MSPFHSSLLQSSSSVSHVNNVALLKFHVILSKVVQHLCTTYKLDLQIDFNIQTYNQDKKVGFQNKFNWCEGLGICSFCIFSSS